MAEDKTKTLKESITYVPGQHDPVSVRWGGHTFHANVAKEIAGNPNGTTQEQLNHQIIESARTNPHFRVGDAKAPKKSKPDLPADADGYKSYMIAWMQNERFESADDLIARFVRDRDLQITCEVGPDDFAYLGTLFLPKLSDLAKAESMSEGQIASAWLRHGVHQLPF